MGNKSRYSKIKTYGTNYPDYEWYEKKVDGHGGATMYIGDRLKIGYIGSIPKYKIMWFNTILYYRWLKRKLVRNLEKIFNI